MPKKTRRRRGRSPSSPPRISQLVREALAEDEAFRDLTTARVLPRPVPARARVTAQARGVLSGIRPATAVAGALGVRVVHASRDGDRVRPGTVVLELRGDARRILAGERTLLNFLMHLSGVATLTAQVVARARTETGRRRVTVLATRKTIPGLRSLEKAAVVAGGGEPHRRDLASAVLIKNNHLALVPIREAVTRARAGARRGAAVEVEVRSLAQVREALAAGADTLLLDNFPPSVVRAIMQQLEHRGRGRRPRVEASGGITLENVRAFARTGVDAVSLGALTHSAPALPFHLTVTRARPPSRAT